MSALVRAVGSRNFHKFPKISQNALTKALFDVAGYGFPAKVFPRNGQKKNRGKFSGAEEKSDAAAPCKNHQKSALYPFSRSSGALNINATTLYFWILIADIQSYSGFVSSVLSESNLLTSVVFVIVYFMLVYGM